MTQEQKQRQRRKPADQEQAEPQDQRDADLNNAVEDLLGEIDDVLEENAQEFVEGFVQQGGE